MLLGIQYPRGHLLPGLVPGRRQEQDIAATASGEHSHRRPKLEVAGNLAQLFQGPVSFNQVNS